MGALRPSEEKGFAGLGHPDSTRGSEMTSLPSDPLPQSPHLLEALPQGPGLPVQQELIQDVLHSACTGLGLGPGAPGTRLSPTRGPRPAPSRRPSFQPTRSPTDARPGSLDAPVGAPMCMHMHTHTHTGKYSPCTHTRTRKCTYLSQHRYSWDLRSSLEFCTWKPSRASCSSPGQPALMKSRKGP